jgi:hypothetical protein
MIKKKYMKKTFHQVPIGVLKEKKTVRPQKQNISNIRTVQ